MATPAVVLQPSENEAPIGPEARGATTSVPPTISVVTAGPSLFSGDVLLGSLGDARLRVVTPLTVRFSRDQDHVVAEAPELDELGFGADAVAARLDLQRAIVELYFALERDEARLGADLRRVWGVLRSAISRVR